MRVDFLPQVDSVTSGYPNTVTTSLTVWDQESDPHDTGGEVVCWRSYAQGFLISSLPHYVEKHAEGLRSKYLAFIHDLGESRIDGRRIVDHLDMGDGFSFWWMTLLAEKSPYKSSQIYDCLRLMALEEILLERKPSHLTLHGSDRNVAQAIRRLCRHLHIKFAWQHCNPERKCSWRWLYHGLPYWAQGLLSLRHLAPRWLLRKGTKPQWFSGESAIFLCSYFTHLDPASCAQGRFYSRLWEVFPKYLHDRGRRINWIQQFLCSAEAPDARAGLRLLQQFNGDAGTEGHHAFLDSYLTWGLLVRVLKNWAWLCSLAWRLRSIQTAFQPIGSAVWLWPILRGDWRTSVMGPVAINNCLSVALFDAALKDIPVQKTGLYICENLAWERALVRAWRKHGHGQIIAVHHATVPFWSLLFFDDPRSLNPKQDCALPLPDRLAVNGPMAWRAFTEAGYPIEQLVEVEALRYLNLLHVTPTSRGKSARRHDMAPASRGTNVLILGDCLPEPMHNFLSLIEDMVKFLPSGYQFTFKPHPRYDVNLAEYPGLPASVTAEALDRLWGGYDIIVAITSTNAAVEAYVAGMSVVIGLDRSGPNVSPLRGMPDVIFVSTPKELAEALQTAGRGRRAKPDHQDFFFLDPSFARWERVLSERMN